MNMTKDFTTRFTALGLSGSGKTCYVMGMYSEMACGIRGWTIKTANADADKIARQLRIMEDSSLGSDRFPPGTQDFDFDDYEFELYFRNKKIMNFNWADYAGAILEDSGLNYETTDRLNDSILCSTTLYIFVDGELLVEGNTNKKIKNVRRNCADAINSRITDFMQKHNNMVPPIAFVITKYDLCQQYTTLEEIKAILKESFSSVFYDDNSLSYITTISLGSEISENCYTGEIEPINIQTPFFIGIAHDFSNNCSEIVYEIQQAIVALEDEILRNEEQITSYKSDIEKGNDLIDSSNKSKEYSQQEIQRRTNAIYSKKAQISALKQQINSLDSSISSEHDRIKGYSGGLFVLGRIFHRKDIENAERNIHNYQNQKNSLSNNSGYLEKCILDDNNVISEMNGSISLADKAIRIYQQSIEDATKEINNSEFFIEKTKELIEEKINERSKYIELLKDLMDELKKQYSDKQFIVMNGENEVDFDINQFIPSDNYLTD